MGRMNPPSSDRNGVEESRDNRRKPLFTSSGPGGSKFFGVTYVKL